MYDLFFISYFEPNSLENWQRLKSRFIHAKHISGVKGIDAAHKKAAQSSLTSMFYTVDADTIVHDHWDFSFNPTEYDKNYLHLWYSKNPVNDLEYGYGGIKLWPRKAVIEYQSPWLDFTTSVGNLKIIPTIISTTCFNVSEFETWKSAFRESLKLSINIDFNQNDSDSKQRLAAWLSVKNNVSFADWSIKGAEDGVTYYNDKNDLSIVNDFSRLKKLFTEKYSHIVK